MTSQEMRDEAVKARASAQQALDEATAAIKDGEAERASELEAQASAALESAEGHDRRAKMAEELARQKEEDEAARLTEAKSQRRHQPVELAGGPDRENEHKPTTVGQLRTRARYREWLRKEGSRSLSEEHVALATQVFPEERLFADIVLAQASADHDVDEATRTRYAAYAQANRDMTFGTANQGGDLAPENWNADIVATMAYIGGFANFGFVEVVTQPGNNKFHTSQLTDMHDKEAQEAAENTAVTKLDYATDEFDLSPRRRAAVTTVTVDFVRSTRFQTELTRSIGSVIGRKVNSELTIGDGSATKAKGVATVDADEVTSAAANTIGEPDFKMLFKAIDEAYIMPGDPNKFLMVHTDTLKEMHFARHTGGDLLYRLNVADGSLHLANGVPVVGNNALKTTGANEPVAVLGNGSRYLVVRSAGIKVDVGPLDVTKQSFDLGWTIWYDGAPTDERAFRRIKNRA